LRILKEKEKLGGFYGTNERCLGLSVDEVDES
jgi:hypothetical protein